MSQPFPIAVRSLQCEDHAINIPPRVLTVQWNTSKRCNFDCSYCSPHVHDAVSPFLDLDQSMIFVRAMHDRCVFRDQQIKWVFTGGEPFIDPGFMDLVSEIGTFSTTQQLNVTTNGSVSGSIYERAAELFDGITVSLHLERSPEEIQATLDKMLVIRSRCLLSVNVMFLPGQLDRVESAVEWLQANSIAFVVRKIVPNDNQMFLPFLQHETPRKNRVLLSIEDQISRKIQSKQHNDVVRGDRWKDLYSPDELRYLEKINNNHVWNNLGVWYSDDSYHEHNSDFLLSKGLVAFQGWTCWAGVDCVYVDFDGSIYRGMCLNDGAVGHISDATGFVDQPTVCQRQWCTCNVDIATRKAASAGMIYVSA